MKNLKHVTLGLIFCNAMCLGQEQNDVANDGILAAGEDVDSFIFQSHGVNRVSGITYDEEALKDYLSAQIEGLKYVSASNGSNLPVDLKIEGSQVQVGMKMITRKYDLSGERIKVPVYKKKWETYYVDIFVPDYEIGTAPSVIGDPTDYESKSVVIKGKPPKMIKKRVKQRRLISAKIVRHKTVC